MLLGLKSEVTKYSEPMALAFNYYPPLPLLGGECL